MQGQFKDDGYQDWLTGLGKNVSVLDAKGWNVAKPRKLADLGNVSVTVLATNVKDGPSMPDARGIVYGGNADSVFSTEN